MPIPTIVMLLSGLGLLLAGGLIGYAVALYNGLVRARTMAEEGWSGVDVQLQRRIDLVPRLADVVRAHAAHERALFEEVVARRSAALAATDRPARANAEADLTATLGRLIAVAEAYPALTADQSFLDLQRNLAEVEDHIQDARRYYNATVRELNVRVESFPSILVAALFGFGRAPFFDPGEDTRLRSPPPLALAQPPVR